MAPGLYLIKLFIAVIYEFFIARLFVPGKPLQPIQMVAGKAKNKATNALAYCIEKLITIIKIFIVKAPGVNLIKLLHLPLVVGLYKLECLSLTEHISG